MKISDGELRRSSKCGIGLPPSCCQPGSLFTVDCCGINEVSTEDLSTSLPRPLTPSLSLPYTSISLLQSQLNCRRVTSVKPPLTFVLSPLFHLSLFSTSSSPPRAPEKRPTPELVQGSARPRIDSFFLGQSSQQILVPTVLK